VVVASLIAGKEYCLLIPLKKPVFKGVFIVLLLLNLWLSGLVFPYWQSLGLVLWVALCFAIVTYPRSQNYWGHPLVVALIALILWPLFMQSLGRIYWLPQGKELVVYVLSLVWAADIGAYCVGRYLGGAHKLIPKVSPGKSWEGVIGGFVLGLIVALVAYKYFAPYSLILWLVIAAFTLISTVFGDLCISIFKRRCQLKDTGDLIPGHGGILDRLDSLIFAAPVFYLGLTYIPIGI
jgi:phosphatidate cytidylyltransferase